MFMISNDLVFLACHSIKMYSERRVEKLVSYDTTERGRLQLCELRDFALPITQRGEFYGRSSLCLCLRIPFTVQAPMTGTCSVTL